MKTQLASFLAIALSCLVIPRANPQDKKPNDGEKTSQETLPFVWGFMGKGSGCVIFKEYPRTKGKLLGLGGKTKTFNGLEVVETVSYSMHQKKWVEDDDDLKELQRISLRDGLTYVKIAENYTPTMLDEARKLCDATTEAK